MATYTKVKLSSSTNGRPIKVAATSSAGTNIHTTNSTSGEVDEIYLYANNTSAIQVTLTLEFGGTSSPDDTIVVGIPPKAGLYLVVPGLCLFPTGSTLSVKAWADTTNVINITGFVNRIA